MKLEKKDLIKKSLIFALCLLPVAIIGGIFTGMYTFEHFDETMRESILQQAGSYEAFIAVAAAQSAMYELGTAFLGYIFAYKTGLLKSFKFRREILIKTVPVIVLFGVLFACDYFVFGKLIPEVAEDYAKGISVPYFLSSLLYGGIIEEILLRWFFMGALVLIIWKVSVKSTAKENIPSWVFVTANFVAAVLFAAGHLPATIALFGHLNFIIVLRCFFLNGAFALLFGRYFRKYGIQYAMLAHFGLHFVSKLILMFVI